MHALITGARGTVGSALASAVIAAGGTVTPWDRSVTPIDDYAAMLGFVEAHRPDVIFHTAIPSQDTGRDNEGWWVNYHWTGELAWIARELGIRFVYTSTTMVFTERNPGPYTPDSTPDADAGYGLDKLNAERRARQQYPDTVIARLGWQIGRAPGGNNMIDLFARHQAQDGRISASTRWLPACAFVEETAAALIRLANAPGGVYLLDSNTDSTFYDIARALNTLHGNQWIVEPSDAFVYDQRMVDARPGMPPLRDRLPDLPSAV